MSERVERALRDCMARLYGYALSLTGNRDAAQDLVQDCVIRAYSAAAAPADAPALRAWLFRILRNVWIDQYRRAHHDPLAAVTGEPEPENWHCDDALIDAITVRQGLARLAPAHREVIALVDLAGFAYAEAAQILDVPVGTVMSRLSRARAALLMAIAGSNVRPLHVRRRSKA